MHYYRLPIETERHRKKGGLAQLHKKRLKIVLAILLVVVVILGAGALFMRQHLKALWYFLRYDTQSTENMIQQNNETYHEAIKELADENIYISDETKKLLDEGGLSEEEILALITQGTPDAESTEQNGETPPDGETTGESEGPPGTDASGQESGDPVDPPDTAETRPDDKKDETPAVTDKSGEGTAAETKPPSTGEKQETETKQEETPPAETTSLPAPTTSDTAKYIAKLYVLKSQFTGELGKIEGQITSEYVALPKEERTPAARKSIAGKYLKTVASLESQCDKDVESLLSDLRTELEAQGKDTSIIETLRKAYNEEKSLKKAYYLDVYTNGISKKG